MSERDVPIISDLLSTLLFLAVLFVVVYSFWLANPDPDKETKLSSGDSVLPDGDPGPLEFFIEPSSIPGQKIPYPISSPSGPELDYSIIVIAQDIASEIAALLESIQVYFAQRPSVTYESIVLDIFSGDGTREAALAFAEQDPCVRVLHINQKVSHTLACVNALARVRGNFIFLWNPSDQISIQSLARYESRITDDDRLLVIGGWLFESEDYRILRSTLNCFLEFATEKLLALANLKASASRHSRTFLFTRDAARLICSKVRLDIESYNIEFLVVAAAWRVRVRVAKLEDRDPLKYSTPSLLRWEQLLATVYCLAVHRFRVDKIRFISNLAKRFRLFPFLKTIERKHRHALASQLIVGQSSHGEQDDDHT
jgi:glycosyltransferase involved in cell wall biosynthesis